ncbi:MAG: Peptidase C14 [uncultured Thiotrichaceae bacterium]|uniref:Peptidase C14 n=1 Tax=uncultured Thiotrichaceae bacterium TaxID=298394 RepID=A0A6S6TCF4_9GAMM|nr:MAG: Peptidase C14 [uncultured Thiotrichaceae bacterium]
MPQGISLHIGLNRIDPQKYGYDGKLNACVNDAIAMQAIADKKGYASTLLLDEAATARNVVVAIQQAYKKLNADDIFMMTYSGHGGQTVDNSKDEDKDEDISLIGTDENEDEIYFDTGGKDETFCFYDRMYWDDELNRQLAQFKPGVRILLIADCCHAESNYKNIDEEDIDALPPTRGFGIEKSMEIVQLHQAKSYTQHYREDFLRANSKIDASLIQLAACKEGELSRDANPNDSKPLYGQFTKNLLKIWDNGHFDGNYQELLQNTGARIHRSYQQTPVYKTEGPSNRVFEQQKPFTI